MSGSNAGLGEGGARALVGTVDTWRQATIASFGALGGQASAENLVPLHHVPALETSETLPRHPAPPGDLPRRGGGRGS